MIDDIALHLDRSDDPTAVILAAHLLIEARLRDILARTANAPEELQEARLSFHQVLAVTRAIVGRQDESVWSFMKRLNEVRNRIAHHLDPGDLDELIGSIVERLGTPGVLSLKTSLERLRVAAHYACGYLEAIKGSPWLSAAYTREEERPRRTPVLRRRSERHRR